MTENPDSSQTRTHSTHLDWPGGPLDELLGRLDQACAALEAAVGSMAQGVGAATADVPVAAPCSWLPQLLEAIPLVLWIEEASTGRIRYVNNAFEQLWAAPAARLYEDAGWLSALVHPDDRKTFSDARACAANGFRHDLTYRTQRPDGQIRAVRHRTFPLYTGPVATWLCSICEDVTEARALEYQFERSERIANLGLLVGGVTHDLNNALSPLVIGIPVLRAGIADAELKELACSMEKSAKRAASMVATILGTARGAEGAFVTVDAGQLLTEFIELVRQTFPRTIRVMTGTPGALWPVCGDPLRLQQVLLNLAINARDAMNGKGELRIGAENVSLRRDASGAREEYVRYTVSDSGPGIPEDIQDRIFEPFFTTKDSGKGTGLGLVIVRNVVREHGGFVTFRSQPGIGTTFEVHLPRLG